MIGYRRLGLLGIIIMGIGLLMGLLLLSIGLPSTTASPRNAPQLVINEVMAANRTTLLDEDGDSSDWFELHNRSPHALNLNGWAMSDDPAQPRKWLLPRLTLPRDGYLLLFASGKNRAISTTLHTNFKLNQTGETLLLHNLLHGQSTRLTLPHQVADVSYGLVAGQYVYLTEPTPGQPNAVDSARQGIGQPVQFSHTRGFYDKPFRLTLHTETADSPIYYTLDGREPSVDNGLRYSEPIPINQTSYVRAIANNPNVISPTSSTHSYIFLNDILRQPHNPPGWPTSWGTYLQYYPGLPLKGAPVLADYAMDRRVVEPFRAAFVEGMQAIPSISLVTVGQNFDIYAHAIERGPEWERPVSVEFFDPQDPTRQFQVNAGIRMQGVSARWEFMPKKSFRLFFKGQYGPTQLEFPLFPDTPVTKFNSLVLRGGANRSYAGYIDAVDYTQVTYSRDQWLRESQRAMSGVGAHGMFVHLYLNGLYWGLYNLVERPDAAFAANHFGGKKADWFAIKHGATVLNPDAVRQGAAPELGMGEAISGSPTRYASLLKLVEQGDLADPLTYAQLQQYLDVARFSDYILLNLYAGNNDWADNNWYAAIRNQPPGRLRYFIWDGEQIWNEGARLYLGKTGVHHKIRPMFLALMENPDFRLTFADRAYQQLFNDGPLTDENSRARWIRLNQPLAQAIIGESARWGDVRYPDNPVDPNDWRNAHETVLQQMVGNGDKLIGLLRQAGYYPPLDPPTMAITQTAHRLTVSLTAANSAMIYYTLDGSDPRQAVTGNPAAQAQRYQRPFMLTDSISIKARAFDGQAWTALQTRFLHPQPAKPKLQITELMYHPPNNRCEFIELKNVGNVPFPLANSYFEGIRYRFPPTTAPLPLGERLVLVDDAQQCAERYPNFQADGEYGGQLSNRGETIWLYNALGSVQVTVTYSDGQGWPLTPDGRGDSLIIVDESRTAIMPHDWRASSRQGGSPGW